MENNLTPEALRSYGFKFHQASGVSGADMWQGMSFWDNKDLMICLRGNCSTARPGGLRLSGHFNCCIDTTEDLEKLLSLFGWIKTN